MTSDTGVQVAPGDPGQLFQAAHWHLDLADGLSAHGHTVANSAVSVSGFWSGEAAASYQALSGIVAAHFWHAAGISQTAAASLHRYATELARLQLEGVQALYQSEHWLVQVDTWTGRLHTANGAVTRAEGEVRAAQTALTAGAASPHSGAVSAAAGQLHVAQGDVTRAQGQQRTPGMASRSASVRGTAWYSRSKSGSSS